MTKMETDYSKLNLNGRFNRQTTFKWTMDMERAVDNIALLSGQTRAGVQRHMIAEGIARFRKTDEIKSIVPAVHAA
tara:strand:- start:127 stop:354 length:228 start_codon:yes stop_codon:yes gene_type:complete